MSLIARFRMRAMAAVLLCAAPAVAQRSGSVPLVDPRQAGATPAGASRPAAPAGSASESILPASFAGWQRDQYSSTQDPAQVDAANAAVLNEYGFARSERIVYTRDDRKTEVTAVAFDDAGGAFGAFTFYAQPEMAPEKIGDAGVSRGADALFYRGNVLVRVHLDRVTAMSAAALRDLAAAIPPPSGAAANLPSLPNYLPRQQLAQNTTKYVAGPVALALLGVPLTPSQLRFDQGAELIAAKYRTDEGPTDLLLISYPTPQLAAERARALEADFAQQPAGLTQAVRRSGPIVVVVSGPVSANAARSLLNSVNYDANVTWSEPTFLGPRNNVGNLVVAALALSGVILLMALVAGVAFGGVRILVKRFYPDRFFDRSSDVEIIRLNIGK